MQLTRSASPNASFLPPAPRPIGLELWLLGAASRRWGEAVASHHFGERRGVRRAARCGLDDGGHLAEVLRPKDAGADDREDLRFDAMIVVSKRWTTPRGMQSTSPGPTSVCRPSSV